jgi:hypothetical protein
MNLRVLFLVLLVTILAAAVHSAANAGISYININTYSLVYFYLSSYWGNQNCSCIHFYVKKGPRIISPLFRINNFGLFYFLLLTNVSQAPA